ncbi:MAG: lysozyme [Acidobacteria bacterium]|nr:lysozyme [Acidobacteriota bacterium]
MKLGRRGRALIQGREKCRLEAYAATESERARGIWTIAWGRTKGVKEGDTCTQEQADQWFAEDVADREASINALHLPLTQAMFDALVSLCYNNKTEDVLGGATVGAPLRRRDWVAAWRGFSWWIHQDKKPVRGLVIRRAEEMALFASDPWPRG